jgi:hypothetical protein
VRRAVVGLIVLAALPAHAQVRKQVRDGAAVQALTVTERAQLGDPLFTLVLKPRPNEARLDEIERLLMGPSGKRHLFVVSEDLLDASAGSRRAVIAYTGRNGTVQLDPNVMLSVSFTDQAFSTEDIEGWGWDDVRSRYNYYKLDRGGGGSLSWKFRGSSVNADAMTTAERAGTCMRCHITGAPVMKELPIPWNNWHSSRSLIGHLSPTATGPWPIARTPRFADLKGAQDLETSFVIPSIKQFNGRRADALVGPLTAGMRTVTNGPRLLKSLFVTTEYNITSADQSSGLHPFPKVGAGPEAAVVVPDTFFLNANVLAGGSFTRYEGLGVTDARQFSTVLRLTPAEYRDVVRAFTTNVEGRDFDTHFAWFVPEASHSDNQTIDILVRRGIVTAEFAAAALSVDLERPVFSEARESLLAFMPKTYRFKPRGAHGDSERPGQQSRGRHTGGAVCGAARRPAAARAREGSRGRLPATRAHGAAGQPAHGRDRAALRPRDRAPPSSGGAHTRPGGEPAPVSAGRPQAVTGVHTPPPV